MSLHRSRGRKREQQAEQSMRRHSVVRELWRSCVSVYVWIITLMLSLDADFTDISRVRPKWIRLFLPLTQDITSEWPWCLEPSKLNRARRIVQGEADHGCSCARLRPTLAVSVWHAHMRPSIDLQIPSLVAGLRARGHRGAASPASRH
jgi:hypothetical protein